MYSTSKLKKTEIICVIFHRTPLQAVSEDESLKYQQ